MIHRFNQGLLHKPVFFLLHGTGGDETDFLPLAQTIDADASVLSVRGDVSENGLNRFFKRLSVGVFDEADLVERTARMVIFLEKMAKNYAFSQKQLCAIGYSNGANIAASLLFHHLDVLPAAVLMHPVVPRKDITLPDLSGVSVLITAGINDPFCPLHETKQLESMLRAAGADVKLAWFEKGHQISHAEVATIQAWYETLKAS